MEKQQLSPEEVDEEYVRAIFKVEKELGHYVDDNYPVMKLFEEVNMIAEHNEKEKEQMDGLN